MSERCRLLLLAGRNLEELRVQLAVDDQVLLKRNDSDCAPYGGPYRLALIDADAQRLARARQITETQECWKGRHDIWFTAAPLLGDNRGRLAFVFPGVEQRFDPAVDDVAMHFSLPRPELMGTEHSVLRRSISVLAVGRLLDTAVRRIGIEPAVVAGHSIGEWNAMMSAGLFSTTAMDQLIAGVDPAVFELPGCLFAALGCGAELAQQAIAGLEDVVISHDNCPHQSIICGAEHAVKTATKRLAEQGVLSHLLNFRSGFHSPMLAPYLEQVSAVAKLPIGTASVPVWSATTAEPYPTEPNAIRELVIRHLLEPVRFRALIERLYASGIRAFVQAGVGSLTGFIDDILAGRDYITVAANVAGQSGLRQLWRTAAALWVEGARLRFDLLVTGSSPIVVKSSHPVIAELAKRSHPVIAELEAVLTDAAEASRAVTAKFAAMEKVEDRMEAREMRYKWTLSLDELPFVIDHCLVRQPASWPVLSDRQPVIPLTTTFELMRDVARGLVAERTPITLRKVSALRWLALDTPLDLDVTAKFDGRESVELDLGGYARATVLVREQYPEPPAADTASFANEHPAPVTAAQLYTDHWLFHGPLFQGIEEISVMGDDGLRGRVRTPASTGALIDCAGQLMVFWILATLGIDRYTLPAGVNAVEFFGPQPSPGTLVTATVRIRSVTPRTVYADLELADVNNHVWARLTGFENRRFATDDVTWPVLRYPELNTIGESDPGGWVRLTDRWPDAASRELIARRYFNTTERQEYHSHAPRGLRHWLMGRIAAKDAVRRWLWAQGAGPLFPVEIAIRTGPQGRPIVNVPDGSKVCVSIAHSSDVAVAIADEQETGIDIEIVEQRPPGLEAIALSAGERQLLERLAGDATDPEYARSELFTRFWAAKEAVSKAEGTGLAGRPTAFTVAVVDGELLTVIVHERPWDEYEVKTTVLDGPSGAGSSRAKYVVAWTHIKRLSLVSHLDRRTAVLSSMLSRPPHQTNKN